MRITKSGLGILAILMAIMTAGCGSNSLSSELASDVKSTNDSTGISIEVEGSFLSSSDVQRLEDNIVPGLSIREALVNSRITELSPAGASIQSIRGVTLDPTLQWAISINGDRLDVGDWDTNVNNNDVISIEVLSSNNTKNVDIIIVTVNGGRLQPELTHSYVGPYTNEVVIRDLLKQSGIVVLSDNNKMIKMVQGYNPKVNEKWVLKVNNKLLNANGLDMKLKPQDEVTMELNNS
ncbi:DUF4430 domain-containing protein [Paenibacillus glacialis]|uniref:Transcobalamin-like C-terminal domain-containing protein n=1 Tax=Paenibacillus glacialis TaxID=494026 RepID=A0A168M1P7_9BACL|nr:DUF4430 domain-containing protein [Paenibacillus glacialis]OAB44115.1 hypothetical protein PGLA_05450 [Paenibacillus glacialis]